ncbi:hypothetical protein [Naasia sp. SYSU D00057]|uniref:hypothetical protein n=1 Tax=Naasia sp. SYSU D00057 TaxID=2817380 RepID=UPI001FEEA5E2|nr:hypothetical protein [Naasia sp. SYSU D00057]
MSPPSPAAPAAVQVRRPLRTWDLVLSIVLLLLTAGLGLLLLVMSPFLVMASDPCGSGVQCDLDQMGVGFGIALLGPVLVVVAGIVVTVVLLVLRRLAFWVPLVTSALAAGVFVLGLALIIGAVPGATF